MTRLPAHRALKYNLLYLRRPPILRYVAASGKLWYCLSRYHVAIKRIILLMVSISGHVRAHQRCKTQASHVYSPTDVTYNRSPVSTLTPSLTAWQRYDCYVQAANLTAQHQVCASLLHSLSSQGHSSHSDNTVHLLVKYSSVPGLPEDLLNGPMSQSQAKSFRMF